MKVKYLISVLIFFSFIPSTSSAQDTIVLNSGKKILAKHIQIRKKIFYKHFEGYPHRRYDSVDKTEVNYIIHQSGWKIPMIPPPWYEPIIFSPGIGLSGISMQFYNYLKASGANIITFPAPIYSFNLDYTFTPKLSIGIGAAWQTLKINPAVTHSSTYFSYYTWTTSPTGITTYTGMDPQTITITAPNYSVVETLTRLNIGCRILYHIRNDEVKDFYLGTRVGVSFWTDQSNPPGTETKGSITEPSIQAFVGLRREITNFIGFYVEGGVGSPYFGMAGIYFKVNTSKK